MPHTINGMKSKKNIKGFYSDYNVYVSSRNGNILAYLFNANLKANILPHVSHCSNKTEINLNFNTFYSDLKKNRVQISLKISWLYTCPKYSS